MTWLTRAGGTLPAGRSSYPCEPVPAHRERAARRAAPTSAPDHSQREEVPA